MRVKRAAVLFAMMLFLALTVSLTLAGLSGSDEAPVLASQSGSAAVPSAPSLGSEAGAASRHEGAADGIPVMFVWVGALASSSGVVVSFVVFRSEVRKEKAAIKARKNRADYYKDLRKYNAQLKGPPRDNT